MSSPAIAPEATSPLKKPARSSPEPQQPQETPVQAQPPAKPPVATATPRQQQQRTQSLVSRQTASGDGEAGDVVGEYVLGETIGKGTFGKVKIGLHLPTGEKVAVKILEKKRIVQVADVERVAREIKILKRNRHLNVIQVRSLVPRVLSRLGLFDG